MLSAFLFSIVHSSQNMTLVSFNSSHVPGLSIILKKGPSTELKFNGNFNIECAVQPPNKFTATPKQTTAKAISPFNRISASIRFIRKVLLVPSGAFTKITPPYFFQ